MNSFEFLSWAVAGTSGAGAAWGAAVGHLKRKQIDILYQPQPLVPGHDDHCPMIFLSSDELGRQPQSRHKISGFWSRPKTSLGANSLGGNVQQESKSLRGWIDNPGKDFALVYHGGSSEQIELRREAFEKSFPHHTRYLLPYRGFGPNTEFLPSEKALKKDAEDLFDWVKTRHERVVVVGRSLGTSIASHVAARKPVDRLALVTPFYSVLSIAQHRYKWAPVRQILADWHEVWKDAQNIQIPTAAFLAKTDLITPHEFWHRLRDHFRVSPDVVWGDGDHNSIVLCDHFWGKVADFIRQDMPHKKTPFDACVCEASTQDKNHQIDDLFDQNDSAKVA